jgi:Sulfate permease family
MSLPLNLRFNYSADTARRDLVAGATVAAIAIPQAMAYALIAGVDPRFGLYSAIVVEVLQVCRSGRISWTDMVLAPSVAGLFKCRQFEPEVILLAVGWYLRFSLSYRDVEELLAERGLRADHVTVWRWVQRYAPEIQRRLRPRLRPTNDSWRVDET